MSLPLKKIKDKLNELMTRNQHSISNSTNIN